MLFAALLHALCRAADVAMRRALCEPGLLLCAGLLGIIVLLLGWAALLDALRPGLGHDPLMGYAVACGLAVGAVLPRPGPRFRLEEEEDDGGDGSPRRWGDHPD